MTEKKLRVSNYPKTLRRNRIIAGRQGKRRIRVSYSRPSFWEGMARVLDIGGTMGARVEIVHEQNDTGKTGAEQDADEIRSIWAEVGQYLYEAMGRYEESERGNSELAKGGK